MEIIWKGADGKEKELEEGLHSIRGSRLWRFGELLADIRLAGFGKGGRTGAGLG